MPKLAPKQEDAVETLQPEDKNPGNVQKVKKKVPAYVQIQSGEHLGRIIPLNQDVIQLGKTGNNRAVITRRADNYYLSQIDGNKVTINGLPIGIESILLKDGNLIQMGAIRVKFFSA